MHYDPSREGDIRMPESFAISPRFAEHFSALKQVFLYINDDCNLSCRQCIYKPHVTYHESREIPIDTVTQLLASFHALGARKLTLLGGEPTLYGRSEGGRPLARVLRVARELGYTYIRMDTNGQFAPGLFDRAELSQLDELAFSIDGYDAATSDRLRGEGAFAVATTRFRAAVARGINCSITCCVQDRLVEQLSDGLYGVERVIRLGEELGASVVNFHDLFKAGVPMDTWTGDFNPSVDDYVEMYNAVRPKIERGDYTVGVRLPQCFVTRSEFERNSEYYGYCPVKLGERVMVHSDGVIRICSNLICSSFGSATFDRDGIHWNTTSSNELAHHDLEVATPCTNRSKNMSYGEYVPLCFSFKPNQPEPVWEGLDWDSRRQVGLTPPSAGLEIQPRRTRKSIPVMSDPLP